MDDLITLLLIVFLVLESLGAIASGIYIARVYRQRDGDSEYLRRLVVRDVAVALGGIPIMFLVLYGGIAFVKPEWHIGPFPRPWGSLMLGIPLVIFLWGVIGDALQFYRDRRIGRLRKGGE